MEHYKSYKYSLENILKAVEMRKDSATKTQILEATGIPPHVQKDIFKHYGIKFSGEQLKNALASSKDNYAYTKEQEQQIILLRKEGLTKKEIATKLSIPAHWVTLVCKRNNIKVDATAFNEMVKRGISAIPEEERKASKLFTQSTDWKEKRGRISKEIWANVSAEKKAEWVAKRVKSARLNATKNGTWPIVEYNRKHHLDGEESFQKRLEEIAKERNGKYLSIYSFSDAQDKWFCNIHQEEFEKTPHLVVSNNSWCNKCTYTFKSKQHQEIEDFIKQEIPDITIVSNDRALIKPKEIDIFLPSKKLAIEYNGLFCHGEWSKGERAYRYHIDKTDACEALGVRLITIFSDEWIETPDKCKWFLKSILGTIKNRIGARNCSVEQASPKEAHGFMDTYHIQGGRSSTLHYKLTYNAEIVAAASFLKTSETDETWELTRYCVKGDWSVAGGLGKIMSTFEEEYHPKTIISFSDRRWSAGGLYRANGFTHDTTSKIKPSYSYFKKSSDHPRYHKSLFRKQRISAKFNLDPGNNTERALMETQGYDRIWDCGKIRWIKTFS